MNIIRWSLARSLALVFLFLGRAPLWADTITWTNASGGNWNVADNWSPNHAPGAADTALINTPGTYIVNVNSTAGAASLTVGGAAGVQTLQVIGTTLTATSVAINGTLTATNSTLNGAITVNGGGALIESGATFSGTVTVASGGVLDENGGTLASTGSLTVQGGGVLNVAATFYLQGPLTNAGTINLTNAAISLYNNNGVNWAGGIDNRGEINLYGASGDRIYSSSGSGYEYLINQGTVNEQAGAGTSSINAYAGVLVGTYNAAPGTTLQFSGGSASSPLTVGTPLVLNGPGQYQFTSGYLLLTVDAIPNLALTGGTLELGPGFQQGGAITNLTLDGMTLEAGTHQVNGVMTATNGTLNGAITVNGGGALIESGATFSGTVTVASGGVLDENGGTLASTGSLTVQGGGVLNVASTFYVQGPLTNAGRINLTNAAISLYNNNGVNWAGGIDNRGEINLYGASGDRIYSSSGSGYEYLINQGTVNEQAGAGTSSINAYAGVLVGTYNAAPGTTLQFSGGSASSPLTVGTPLVLNGPGQYQFTSGYLLLTVDGIANLALTGGTLELGPGFQQGGAITNLTLDGMTLEAGTHQVNGVMTATNGTLNGAITVNGGGALIESGATFSGTVTVASGGVLDENGGTLASTGSLTVQGGGVLNVAATFYVQGPLTNAGRINLTNAAISLYNNNGVNWAGGIDNRGEINLYGASGDRIYSSSGSGYEYLINQGTVNEQAGAGTSSINAYAGVLVGTYNAAPGTTLQFSGGSASSPLTVGTPLVLNGPGQYQFTSGYLLLTVDGIANLALTGGTLELGPGFQQGGTITNLTLDGMTLEAGTHQVNGVMTATNGTLNGAITVNGGGALIESGATFSGTVTVASGGVLDENGGTLANTGSLTVQGGGVLNVAATFYVQGPLTNAGRINLTNAAISLYNNNGVNWAGGIDNRGEINLYGASGDRIYSSSGSGYEYLINQGTVNEQAGAGTSSINAYAGVLVGTYNAAPGTTLQFSGGSASSPLTVGTPLVLNGPGQYQFTSGYLLLTVDAIPNLALTGGTLELGPGFQQGGAITNLTLDGMTLEAGTHQVNGVMTATNGTLNGAITVNGGGALIESGATFSGTVTVASGGVLDEYGATLANTGSLTVQGGGVLNVAATFYLQGPLTNAGTINLTNAAFYLYNNNGINWIGGINNHGEINFYGASGDHIYSYGAGGEYLINQGTISQRPGTGNSSINVVLFTDPGTVDSQAGTFALSSVSLQSSSVLSVGLNSATDYGNIALNASVVLNGTFSANLNNSFVPAKGEAFNVVSYPSFSGSFANINLPTGIPGEGVYGPTVFSLLFTGAGVSTNQPVLTIERVNAHTVVVLWPTAAGNFGLQTSTNLSSGSWSDVLSGIATVGADYVLTNTAKGKAAFFRLQSQ